MAEVLVEFDTPLRDTHGRLFAARVCGREREDKLWEGWIEFTPLAGGAPLRSGRETTQPNHRDLLYWVGGLTAGYLDGALMRTLSPPFPNLRAPASSSKPWFDDPATPAASAVATAREPVAVLDPFAVYAAGDTLLRGQLNALSDGQLRTIIRAHRLSTASPAQLDRTPRLALIEQIMSGVEALS